MPEPTNTSFIPKRGPIQKENRSGRRKVYVGTIIVRILFFAAVVAAGSVYAYERKLEANLNTEVETLNTHIATFNEKEMQRVLAFDERLKAVNYRLDHTASLVALLKAMEAATVDVVQLTQLTVERQDDKNFTVVADLKTPSFDIALFQRQILEDTDTLLVSSISDLSLQNVPPSDPLFSSDATVAEEVVVSFKADLTIDVDKIPYVPATFGALESTTIVPVDDLEMVDEQPPLGAEIIEENPKSNEI